MHTYEKHKAAVRQRIRQTFDDMLANTGPIIVLEIIVNGHIFNAARGEANRRQVEYFKERITGEIEFLEDDDDGTISTLKDRNLLPEDVLAELAIFNECEGLFEVPFHALVGDAFDALRETGAAIFLTTLHPAGRFAYAGFIDMRVATKFRLEEHGHILLPMQPD